ncbi:hypothetical protein J4P02_01225 [Pseudomonas sp. NFXW11]|uniref:YCF48-related protein n=1 Tax=Pseudomonas sp. NFXW11 TaxID=2819531 RepID=UPI003CEF6F74
MLGFLALLVLGVTSITAWWQAPSPFPISHQQTRLEWFTTPIERNAPLRLPAIPSSLNAVNTLGNQRAWAVGLGGGIFTSTDAGNSWASQPSPVKANLRGLHFQADGRQAWIVGDGGTLLSSDDAGASWRDRSLQPARDGLIDLLAIEVNERTRQIWVVGALGVLLSSNNDGSTWRRELIGQADASSIRFSADGARGWITARGTVLFSTNQGATWTAAAMAGPSAKTGGPAPQFKAVWFTGQYGWAVGENGVIVSSSNYGRNWSAPQATPTRVTLNSIVGSNEGLWAVGDKGTLLFSDDGVSWQLLDSGTQADLRDLALFASPQQTVHNSLLLPWLRAAKRQRLMCDGRNLPSGEASGLPDSVSSSAEQSVLPPLPEPFTGQTESAPEPTPVAPVTSDPSLGRNLLSYAATGPGIAVGDAGTIITRRSDGLWAPRSSAAHRLLRSVQVSDNGKTVIALGDSGTLLSSRDGADSWYSNTDFANQRLNGSHLTGDGLGAWAVGDNGRILSSRDAGANWSEQASTTSNDLLAVDFDASGRFGIASGRERTLLYTHNGGDTWAAAHEQRSPGQNPPEAFGTFYAVHLDAAGVNAWAVGDQGLIASSTDAGKTWDAVQMLPSPLSQSADQPLSALAMNLRAVAFLADGRTGWIAGDNGVIAKTLDGGASWRVKHRQDGVALSGLQMRDDGTGGWASSSDGLILVSTDQGETWAPAHSDSASPRLALAMAQNGVSGLSVGYPPALWRTTDGGQSWASLPWPLSHRQYPAPWFWFALALCALLVWLMFRPRPSDDSGAAAIAATDAPTDDSDKDSLGVAPLARGISRFLRNTRTEPPLTLAISGGWGAGKSSLMALICQDLRRYKYRPVWFNAWHHQSEEQLLASLLNAIDQQGLPSLLSLDGWAFRLHLLWIRSRRHLLLALGLVAAASCLVSYLLTHPLDEWGRLWQWLQSLVAMQDKGVQLSRSDVGKLLGQLATGLVTFKTLLSSMKAFGVSPATLLSDTAKRLRTSDGQSPTSFRSTFARQFGEVTEALPYRTVIVIDDLDRCRPEIILTIMEAVNFLVTSGRCFVIFGMDTCYIRTALGLHFEKFADELALRQKRDNPEQPEPSAAERRWNYAGNYLEKLVNLEIQVPQHADLSPLLRSSPSDSAQTRSFMQSVGHFWPFYLFALVMTLGIATGKFIQLPLSPAPLQPPASVASTVPTPAPGPQGDSLGKGPTTRVQLPPTLSNTKQPLQTQDLHVQASQHHPMAIWSLAAALLLFVLFSLGVGLYRLRTSMRQVNDSTAFNQALDAWLPVVRKRHATPRAIKRFINRIRYLAMLQQGEKLDRSLFDELLRRRPANGPGRSRAVQEHRLVALGALHEIYQERWRHGVKEHPDDLASVIDDYRQRTRSEWPPADAELDAFESSLRGVRVAGEVQLLADDEPGASSASYKQ